MIEVIKGHALATLTQPHRVTRAIRSILVEVSLDRTDGMPVPCVVKLDDITTLPKVLIEQLITALSADKVQQIDETIRFALNLD